MALNYILMGKRVTEIRKKRGLSQLTLSEMVGISPQSMSNIEMGVKGMRLDTFVAVANALNVSADEILVDELKNTVKVTNHAFAALLSDTSEYEKRIMLMVVSSVKEALRSNKGYFTDRK